MKISKVRDVNEDEFEKENRTTGRGGTDEEVHGVKSGCEGFFVTPHVRVYNQLKRHFFS